MMKKKEREEMWQRVARPSKHTYIHTYVHTQHGVIYFLRLQCTTTISSPITKTGR